MAEGGDESSLGHAEVEITVYVSVSMSVSRWTEVKGSCWKEHTEWVKNWKSVE